MSRKDRTPFWREVARHLLEQHRDSFVFEDGVLYCTCGVAFPIGAKAGSGGGAWWELKGSVGTVEEKLAIHLMHMAEPLETHLMIHLLKRIG